MGTVYLRGGKQCPAAMGSMIKVVEQGLRGEI
jgi:hypothetical protein